MRWESQESMIMLQITVLNQPLPNKRAFPPTNPVLLFNSHRNARPMTFLDAMRA